VTEYSRYPGFSFEAAMIDMEIYRLVSIVHASRPLSERPKHPSVPEPDWEWLRDMESSELSRLLVQIAAMARNGIDATGAYGIDWPERRDEIKLSVGTFVPDKAHLDKTEVLGFREACNKILHALKVQPERQGAESSGPLTGIMILEGEYRGKDWIARLNMVEFGFAAFKHVP
jgi:hypothetical protein